MLALRVLSGIVNHRTLFRDLLRDVRSNRSSDTGVTDIIARRGIALRHKYAPSSCWAAPSLKLIPSAWTTVESLNTLTFVNFEVSISTTAKFPWSRRPFEIAYRSAWSLSEKTAMNGLGTREDQVKAYLTASRSRSGDSKSTSDWLRASKPIVSENGVEFG